MSAREIIASALTGLSKEHRHREADHIYLRLVASGHRIVAPGSLDDETLERAAQIADDHEGKPCGHADGWTEEQRDFYDCGQIDATTSLAVRYRALKNRGQT